MLNFSHNTQQLLERAFQFHQAGNLPQAETLYRQILSADPRNVDALHLLGLLARQACHLDAAVELLTKAVAIKPDFPEALCNLGTTLQEKGRLDEAIACGRKAIALRPEFPDAHYNLGIALKEKGQLDEAIACYRKAIALRPDFDAYYNLGLALQEKLQWDDAVACYRQALALKPDFAEAHNNLGSVLKDMGQLKESMICCRQALALKLDFPEAHCNLANALKDAGQLNEAVISYRRAIDLKPDFSDAHNNLGNTLRALNRSDEAIACYRKAIELKPDYCNAHSNLGGTLHEQGRLEEAIISYRKALSLWPDFPEAHNNLGSALKDMGQLDEALACYRRAVALKPDFSQAHSNLAYVMHFHPDATMESIYQEHVRWNQQHAAPLAKFIKPHGNNRNPGRRLKIGYVSPDFRRHPVGRFLLPLFQHHDHQQVEIFCYASQHLRDNVTEKLAASVNAWRAVRGLNDAELADLIRQDQIDILVDLSLHMAGNRLLAFARKPAPVQVSWLGYPGTTGLTAIDYRITDAFLDPPGLNDAFYSEQTVRLPIAACYQPVDATPPVNVLPAVSIGHITFGCLNNFCKVTEPAIAAWIRLLQANPDSHLLLYAQEGHHRQRARDVFAGQGIDSRRLDFVGFGGTKYFEFFHRIDIALDPFPYGGGTTTCESLWMGAPIVTLAGTAGFSRMGLSPLASAGLPELVAHNTEDYIQVATALAHDLPRLAHLRSTLRQTIQTSPLMDAPRFARSMEAAYRQMWQTWCAKQNIMP